MQRQGAHSHSRAVTPTVVRLARPRLHPMPKSDAVTPIGVSAGILMESVDIRRACEQTISHRYCKYCVIREPALRKKEREIRAFLCHELVYRADYVASDGAEHLLCDPISKVLSPRRFKLSPSVRAAWRSEWRKVRLGPKCLWRSLDRDPLPGLSR
jgi:hypothetical protein